MVAERPATDVPAARITIGVDPIALLRPEAVPIAVLFVVRTTPVALAIVSARPWPATIIAAPVVASPVPTAIAVLTATVPVLAATIVVAVAAGAGLVAPILIRTSLIAAPLPPLLPTTIGPTTILAAAIRARPTVASGPVGLAARLLGLGSLGSLGRLLSRRRLGRRASAATTAPVGPAATAVATIAPIAARLGLLLIAWLLALPTTLTLPALAFDALTATAAVAAAAITARAVLPLLALGDDRRSGPGFRRHAAQQRESHGGRDQTLHFVLQEALCAAPALSLDNQHRLSRMNRV